MDQIGSRPNHIQLRGDNGPGRDVIQIFKLAIREQHEAGPSSDCIENANPNPKIIGLEPFDRLNTLTQVGSDWRA